jgi:NAD(P)-dependent dehydrogenase (short-subunit alcohol dehydrogenase family)
MVSLAAVQASNACIPTTLPPGLVAIFIGGTSGIGEYTLKEFARLARQPRIYNIGRSRQASDRIAVECKKLNADAQYTFIQADVSLIRSVDAVCKQIRAQEKVVNILFLSAGTLTSGVGMYFVMIVLFARRIV